MKKHILGFLVFSLIIGVSIFVFGLFKVETISCRLKREEYKEINQVKLRQNSGFIKQAVYNEKTKLITVELSSGYSKKNLNFYAKSGSKYRYLKTIFTEYDAYQIIYPRESLGEIKAHENLYILAESTPKDNAVYTEFSKFNEDLLVPVLIDYGK